MTESNLIPKRLLIVAPHPDDELGCAGTIAKYIEQGTEVHYMTFSLCQASIPKEFPSNILEKEVIQSTSELGIKPEYVNIHDFPVRKLNFHRQDILELLIKKRNDFNPDWIFTPSLNDVHQDHKTCSEEVVRAFKNKTILGFELPWNLLTFNYQCFVTLEKHHIDKKINTIAQYKSQQFRHYTSAEFIKSWADVKGSSINAPYAEAFEVIRWIH